MSSQDESSSGSDNDDDAIKGCYSGMGKGSDNLTLGVEDNDEESLSAVTDKETLDHSSDEFHKTEGQKRDKKNYKSSKSKVKIKTLTIDGQLVYFCKICDKIFTRRKDKLNHELAHSGESVLTCTECGKEYLHESSLASHMRTHAGDPLYMCDLCPKMFAQSHHLKTHILSHSEPTNFVCKTCYTEFPTSSDLNHHNRIQSKLEMTKYWCKMCKVFFCRSHKLTCDRRLHAFCCSACNELFHTHKKLKIHVKKFAHYTVGKPKYIEPLQEHELYPDKVQESMKKLQAQKENDLPKKPFKNDLNRKRHSEQFEEVPLKKFKLSGRKLILDGDQSSTSLQDSAPEADKDFQELKSPTKHRKGKPYCKKCNKSFKDSLDLDRHKALVHEEKQDTFTCEICSMGFSSKGDLDMHGLKHSGEHIHTCPVCGQDFSSSVQLTKHLRIHVGDFPYKCTQCGKAFRLKIQLIQHVRLHISQDANTSEKYKQSFSVKEEHQDPGHDEADTFQCHLCNKKFYFRYKLQNHLRLHTNVKCFQCYICHKSFATKCYLQRHLQVHIKQGMDVDVQNIIIDNDLKPELSHAGEQFIKDNLETNETVSTYHTEREDLRKSLAGFRRSASDLKLGSRAKDYCSTSSDRRCKDNENQNLVINNRDIKVEVEDDNDSISEHSFCSSFTRDSERSDPFKFSSDESYSFKTAMAKERRRLKRRWKKNRALFMKSDLPALTDLQKNTLKIDDMCQEARVDQGDDITDMMVELNAVKSEHDDVTTVYVTLMNKKFVSFDKVCSTGINETDASLKNNSSLPKLELNIKDEMEEKYENNDSEVQESNSYCTINTPNKDNKATNSGKMLMFEFDVEKLLDGDIKLFSDGAMNIASDNKKVENHVVEEPVAETKAKENKNKTELTQNISSDNISLPKNTKTSDQKSHLKFVTLYSNVASESSNLEKLQAVFEHSSKYLPLSQTSKIQQCQQSPDQSHAQDQTVPDTKVNEIISNSPIENYQHKSVSQEGGDRITTVQTSLSMQDGVLAGQKQQEVKATESKSPQIMNSGHDSRTVNLPVIKMPENSSKSATAEITSNNKCDQNIFAKRRTKKSNTVTDRNLSIGNSVTSSQILPNTGNCNFTTSVMPQPLNSRSVRFETPQSSSNSSVNFITPASAVNTLSHYRVTGSSESSGVGQLPVNLQSSSIFSMNLNPPFGSVAMRDMNTDSTTVSSSYNSNHTNTISPFGSCLITANPLVTPSYAVGLNTPANQSLQFAVNQNCFALNQSAIFDATNPVYRDMNMMDLISTPSTDHTQTMTTTNMDLLRQSHFETQLGHGITTYLEPQSAILQPQNPFLNVGNPTPHANFGNLGNPINNFINQFPVNYGSSNQSLLNVGHVGVACGDNYSMTVRNINGPVYRDDMTAGSSGIPQLSMHMGNFGAQVPMNVASIYPMNSGSFGNLDSLRYNTFNAPVSVNIADFGGSLTNVGLPALNQTNFQYDFPFSIPTNPHIVNNLSGVGALSTSGLQDSLNNLTARSSAVNLLNSAMLPQSNEALQGSSIGFINNFSTGFFPRF